GTYEMPRDYPTYLLAGLLPWLACAEAMMKGTGALVANANLVKQVVFPIEVLPVKSVLSSFITQLVMMGLLLLYVQISHGSLPWAWVVIPVLSTAIFMASYRVCRSLKPMLGSVL